MITSRSQICMRPVFFNMTKCALHMLKCIPSFQFTCKVELHAQNAESSRHVVSSRFCWSSVVSRIGDGIPGTVVAMNTVMTI